MSWSVHNRIANDGLDRIPVYGVSYDTFLDSKSFCIRVDDLDRNNSVDLGPRESRVVRDGRCA